MKNNLRTLGSAFTAKAMKKGFALGLLGLCSFASVDAMAQLNYRPNTSTNTTTTYTDLAATGTVITTANFDDANSTAQPIGFTFNYNGQSFTEFVLNTNGFIKLGNTDPSAATLVNAIGSANAADVNLIAPSSNIDLQGAADQTTNPTEYRVATTGTAPNRVTTIQFENLADKASASAPAQFATMNFQIKLYETTNVIEFVYGTWTASANTPTGQPFIIGLKGSSNAAVNRLMAYKPSSASAWSTTTFNTADPTNPAFLSAHFIRNTFAPDAGRTYRFTPVVIPATDAAVLSLFTMGKLAVSTGTPHAVKALIKNNGSSALTNHPITLTVTGINPFTNTKNVSLAPGEDTTLTFDPYIPTATGTNNVTVSVANDGDNTNNSKVMTQLVTQNTMGYADYSTTPLNFDFVITPINAAGNASEGKLVVKLHTEEQVTLNTVRIYIPDFSPDPRNAAGRTVFAIVLDSTGTEIARSADLVITAADQDKFTNFTITTPPTLENEEFYVGVAVPATTPAAVFFPAAGQSGDAVWTGAFFNSPTVASTTLTDRNSDIVPLIEAELVAVVTGTKAELNPNAVAVYPNPSNGAFRIQFSNDFASEKAVEIRNINGQVVFKGSANAAAEAMTVNVKNLAAGIYILQVKSDNQLAVKRLVIE